MIGLYSVHLIWVNNLVNRKPIVNHTLFWIIQSACDQKKRYNVCRHIRSDSQFSSSLLICCVKRLMIFQSLHSSTVLCVCVSVCFSDRLLCPLLWWCSIVFFVIMIVSVPPSLPRSMTDMKGSFSGQPCVCFLVYLCVYLFFLSTYVRPCVCTIFSTSFPAHADCASYCESLPLRI